MGEITSLRIVPHEPGRHGWRRRSATAPDRSWSCGRGGGALRVWRPASAWWCRVAARHTAQARPGAAAQPPLRAALRSAADEQGPDLVLGFGGDEYEHLVACSSSVSPRGTITWRSRMTATTVASRGTPSSAISLPTAGDVSASVTSTRRASSNWSRRTSDPTETASSTSAVSRWGVETETSTPQASLNSHWFFGMVDAGHDPRRPRTPAWRAARRRGCPRRRRSRPRRRRRRRGRPRAASSPRTRRR